MTASTFLPRTKSEHLASLSVALAPHSSGRHLSRFSQPNEPYFHLSDTAWATCHRLDYKEAELLIRNRASKGFTCVMIVVFVQHGAFLYPNRDGHWPFAPLEGHQETSGDYLPDVTRPNPKYFEFVDKVLDLAASLGVTIALLPTWGRYVTGGYYGSPILFNKENAYEYGRFLGHRYPFVPWFLGGDTNRYWHPDTLQSIKDGKAPPESIDYGPVFESMANGLIDGERAAVAEMDEELQSLAQGYKPFMTFHSASCWLPDAPIPTASAQFPNATWWSFDSCQSGHHDSLVTEDTVTGSHAQAGAGNIPMWLGRSSYQAIRQMYETKHSDGLPRPCLDLEPHYENTHQHWSYEMPKWVGADIRNGGWQAIFAGACGYVYGCNSIIQMHNDRSKTHLPIVPPTTAYTNWYLELDLEGAYSASIMRHVMLSLPDYFSRIPDQSFITSDTQEPADGTAAGDELISGMRGEGWAMVYLPYGGSVGVDLSKALPSQGQWRAWWINPRTCARESFEMGEEPNEVRSFQSPTQGSLGDDWLLLLETSTRAWP